MNNYSKDNQKLNPPRLYLIIAGLLFIMLVPWGYASEVIIVSSSEAAPYARAQRALKKHLDSYGHKSKSISLRKVRAKLDAVISKDTKIFVAVGTEAAKWLHEVIKPPLKLTYCMVANPRQAGLEEGMPVFGVSTDIPLKSQFKIIAEALPEARSVGLLYRSGGGDKTKINKGQLLRETVKANLPQGWRLEVVAFNEYKSKALAIEELFKRDIDIVWTYPEPSVYSLTTIQSVLLRSIDKKKPVFGYSRGIVKAGSLLGVVIEPEKQGQQAAEFVRSSLSNEENLKIEKPETPQFEIAVNLTVAERINADLAPRFLKRAKYVFGSK